MSLFKSKLANRIAISKTIGFVFGLICFFSLPVFFNESDLFMRFGILLWYTSLGGIIGITGIMNKHPVFDMKLPFWFRGPFIGAGMNFILVLFIYSGLIALAQNTFFAGYSPFWLILEGFIFGLIVDYFSTKYAGEGKKLLK